MPMRQSSSRHDRARVNRINREREARRSNTTVTAVPRQTTSLDRRGDRFDNGGRRYDAVRAATGHVLRNP